MGGRSSSLDNSLPPLSLKIGQDIPANGGEQANIFMKIYTSFKTHDLPLPILLTGVVGVPFFVLSPCAPK